MQSLSKRASVRGLVLGLALLAIAAWSPPAFAVAPVVTLPADMPDVGTAIGLVVTGLATVVATCVGGYLGFLLIRRGLIWAKTAVRG